MKSIYVKVLALGMVCSVGPMTSCTGPDSKVSRNPERLTIPAALCAPVIDDLSWYGEDKEAPLFGGLDGINFEITSSSDKAVEYFRQGLMLTYGFNHAEAARSFTQVSREDPDCAMGYWGFAYVLGANYNAAMDASEMPRAYEACRDAYTRMGNASEKEKALIRALQARYTKEDDYDAGQLNEAYAAAMKEVYNTFPDDPDIGTLYAESLMDLHPWDLWLKNGEAQPWTGEILAVLGKILRDYPNHAGANHFYIHAIEASPTPELGLPSAEVLTDLVPGASHLVHMPSHIFINTGDYHKGTLANLKAVDVDSNYVETCHAYGVFPLLYYPHNYHFLSATATFEGRPELALKAAFKVAGMMDTALMKEPGWETLQHYYLIPYHIAVKFGLWDRILSMDNADTTLPYCESVKHYARGMAYVGKNELLKARKELSVLEAYAKDTTIQKMFLWEINAVSDLVRISCNVLKGEILAREGKFDESIGLLQEAVALEDRLVYAEPPDWFFSVRHNLGAVLLEAGRPEEAKKVYLEDLQIYPKNGWALEGLYRACQDLGDDTGAKEAKEKLHDAWQWSDIELTSSRIL